MGGNVATSPPSVQSATIATNDSFILYSSTNNANDSFSYRVSDGLGGTATGTVLVQVTGQAGNTLGPNSIVITGTTATISAFGIPGYTYALQTATNVNGPWWPIATNTASLNDGSLIFVDTNATNSQQYYRTAQP